MNKEQLEEQLRNEIIGQELDPSFVDFPVLRRIEKILNDKVNLTARIYSYERNAINIYYKEHLLLVVEIKRKRGQKHCSFYGNNYDWSYSDLTVTLPKSKESCYLENYTDTDDVIKLIEQQIVREELDKQSEEELALDCLKTIMEKYNISAYEAVDLCRYIDKNSYNLKEKLKKEGN